MIMNNEANIARNLMSKAAYFLLLMDGSKVKKWVERQHDWLNKIETEPWQYPLPHGMNVWQVVEAELKKAFIDYVAHKKAHNDL